ncbi:phospholipase D [Hortaea werneckii]|nr:phospholipase D [Hortaea werneckii]
MPADSRARDESVSPMSGTPPRPASPINAQKPSPEDAEMRNGTDKSNGLYSSPLRTMQRLASLDHAPLSKEPRHTGTHGDDSRSTAATKTGSMLWHPSSNASSFPFDANPEQVGPSPSTAEVLRANGNAEKTSPQASMQRKGKERAESGTDTPPNRHSAQFTRDGAEDTHTGLFRTPTWETENEAEAPTRDAKEPERQASFFGRLKNIASPPGSFASFHGRGQSSSTGFATPSAALSPQSERSEPVYPVEASEAAEQADAETDSEAGDQLHDIRPKKRRKSKRPALGSTDSAPTTPRQSRFASFIREHGILDSANKPGGDSSRQNTLSDVSDNPESKAGVSEDEGRDRIRNAWRRGIEGARGLSYSARKQEKEPETPGGERNRPHHLRRFTGIAGSESPFKMRADRQASTSAQKWKQVKAGLKMLGQRKRDERQRVDHQKSAQLMAELLAGAPAALVFSSMFQRDEHGHKKVPVLLEQLKIRITHSEMRKDNSGDRHLVFFIELEYGNGPARMQWTIRRSLNDFANLHIKYKSQQTADKFKHLRGEDRHKAKMPRFPRSAFPYARGARGLFDKFQDEEEEADEPPSTPGPTMEGRQLGDIPESPANERPPTMGGKGHKRRKSSFAPGPPRRTSTGDVGETSSLTNKQRELYNEKQRKKLETYLQQMIRWLIFRADSTRLCKFLEVSALAVRLSAEGGWQGKQGLLTIYSSRNRELRRKGLGLATLGASGFTDHHKPRWFLIRHSYIVCVDGPESTTPYDVFLVDSDFRTEKRKKLTDATETVTAPAEVAMAKTGKHHLIRLYNSERKLKLIARSERQYIQFVESMNQMVNSTIWSRKQRFGSFAPVRNNVWARWLVDARDHMWQVSRAIDNAKDFVYIHDWWLSPELYLRRPAAISQKWRLDRLLQRKAQEGVKVFVIVYRNIESAIPIDSEYTKWSLLDLHENICVQRSPNQFKQNQFFWAHHEKLVVVDGMMAFVGGVDLCFGRWDEPCHTLTDDKLTGFEADGEGESPMPRDAEHVQVWPGKDYSNPRVQDFYALDRPYEEMYDRTKVPRMPWHDIAMQMVGQPARDVARHFVQRWNYILRNRIPSRPTPVLIPPPEYDQSELEDLGMTGTCQIQILRSCSPWSIGYANNKVEHSIMNAYVHLIRNSEHFVYIENQFYVSSCTVEGTPIHNKIGDALVERAIRAHENGEQWQACLIIPLMPGFQNSVDSQDGTSVRLIMTCQYRSICRGETSIFGRLRASGIEPEDYIRFYSLRQWGKIGPRKCLTTEQLYIHAKCMVVDDRSVIIGSANINERSMLGSRDSEVAAVVTDTKLLPSFMGGEPYEVGEFPHTLRKRLMREHLGLDVDAIYQREQAKKERAEQDREMERIYREDFDGVLDEGFQTPPQTPGAASALTERNLANVGLAERGTEGRGINGWAGTTQVASDVSDSESSSDREVAERVRNETKKEAARDLDVEGYGTDNMKELVEHGDQGFTDSYVDAQGHERLVKKDTPGMQRVRTVEEKDDDLRKNAVRKAETAVRPPWPTGRADTVALGLTTRSALPELPPMDDTDIGGPPLTRGLSSSSASIKAISPMITSMRRPAVHEDCMTDPLTMGFFHDIWNQVAENNTKLYRAVFRCMPDSEVLDWRAYERYNDYNERFMQSQGLGSSKPRPSKEAPGKSGPPGSGGADAASVASERISGGRPRSKTMLSAVVGKLRPGSKASEDTQTESMHEKTDQQGHSPDSPHSVSSEPTAVPSPESQSQALDEKEAIRPAEGPAADRAAAKQVYGIVDNNSNENRQVSSVEGSDEKAAIKPSDSNGDEKSATKQAEDDKITRQRTIQYSDSVKDANVNEAPETTATQSAAGVQRSTSKKGRRRGNTKSSTKPPMEEVLTKEEAEELLKLVQGHLVQWPYDWLEKEERGGNWLYNIDQLAPLEIYD